MTKKVEKATKKARPRSVPQKGLGVGENAVAPRRVHVLKQPITAANPSKPVGETLAADLADPHRKRGTYALLERAISIAMDIPYDAMRIACMTAVKDLQHPDDRIRSRAREFLFKVQDSGVGACVGLDRINRLDDGVSTENISIAAITPEALAAVVTTLRNVSQNLIR